MRKNLKSAGRYRAYRDAIDEVRRIKLATDRATQIAEYLQSSEHHRGARLEVLARLSRRDSQLRRDVLGAIESLTDSPGEKPLRADLIVLRLSLAATQEWYEQGIEFVFDPANFGLVTPEQMKRLGSALRATTEAHPEWVASSPFIELRLDLVLDAIGERGELSELARMLLHRLPDDPDKVGRIFDVLTNMPRRRATYARAFRATGMMRAANWVGESFPRAS